MKHVRGTHAKRMGLHDNMDMIFIYVFGRMNQYDKRVFEKGP